MVCLAAAASFSATVQERASSANELSTRANDASELAEQTNILALNANIEAALENAKENAGMTDSVVEKATRVAGAVADSATANEEQTAVVNPVAQNITTLESELEEL